MGHPSHNTAKCTASINVCNEFLSPPMQDFNADCISDTREERRYENRGHEIEPHEIGFLGMIDEILFRDKKSKINKALSN
jgi:hypothetical protein